MRGSPSEPVAYRVKRRLRYDPTGRMHGDPQRIEKVAAPCPHPKYDECDVVLDLPAVSIPWLLEQGHIESCEKKPVKAVKAEPVPDQSAGEEG